MRFSIRFHLRPGVGAVDDVAHSRLVEPFERYSLVHEGNRLSRSERNTRTVRGVGEIAFFGEREEAVRS